MHEPGTDFGKQAIVARIADQVIGQKVTQTTNIGSCGIGSGWGIRNLKTFLSQSERRWALDKL